MEQLSDQDRETLSEIGEGCEALRIIDALTSQCERDANLAAEWQARCAELDADLAVARTQRDVLQTANEQLRAELTHITGMLDAANATLERPSRRELAAESRLADATALLGTLASHIESDPCTDREILNEVTRPVRAFLAAAPAQPAAPLTPFGAHDDLIERQPAAPALAHDPRITQPSGTSSGFQPAAPARTEAEQAVHDEDRAALVEQAAHYKAEAEEQRQAGLLHLQRASAAAAELATLRSRLPEGMQHCTIRYIECPVGHGRLTATNWVGRGCDVCEITNLSSRSAQAVDALEKVLEALRGR